MIIDNINNSHKYYGLGDKIKKALIFLKENDFSAMKNGNYEIDGSDIYAVINRYETKPIEQDLWEAHRKYIDVQFIASGFEKIGYSPMEKLTVSKEYNEEKDISWLSGNGDFLTVKENMFAVFYPGDGHMPGRTESASNKVLKVVVKVIVD